MGRVEFIDTDSARLWIVGWEPPLQTWFATYEPWPPDPDAVDDPLVDALGTSPHEVPTAAALLDRLRAEHGVDAPQEVRQALADPAVRTTNDAVRFWRPEMVGMPPWQVGTESQRWEGYLDPHHYDPTVGQGVLRNLVGATTYDELRRREDTFVGYRGATLRNHGLPASFDLAGLQSIHRHLFQDVYEWAGELRTVNIAKGRAFLAPEQIESGFAQVAEIIRDTDLLRSIPQSSYSESLALVYHTVNTVHPFREGNGRSQREFITALARAGGFSIDWQRVPGWVNDRASELARGGDMAAMQTLFQRIVRPGPGASHSQPPRLPGAVRAAYPKAAGHVSSHRPTATSSKPVQRGPSGQHPDLSR